MIIKEKFKDLRSSGFVVNRFIYHCLKYCWFGVKFFTNGRFRSETLIATLFERKSHQISTFTIQNRYPVLFQECAQYLSNVKNPQILSFGCSTGEEVFALNKYIPNATIVGVDINRWCLRQARENNKNVANTFIHRNSKEFKNVHDFDIIFCMAVFQRTENRTSNNNSTAQGFLFEEFEAEVECLNRKLKSGGLFVIDHSDFNFTETSCASLYTPLSFEGNTIFRNRPLFDRNNQKVSDSRYLSRVFLKS